MTAAIGQKPVAASCHAPTAGPEEPAGHRTVHLFDLSVQRHMWLLGDTWCLLAPADMDPQRPTVDVLGANGQVLEVGAEAAVPLGSSLRVFYNRLGDGGLHQQETRLCLTLLAEAPAGARVLVPGLGWWVLCDRYAGRDVDDLPERAEALVVRFGGGEVAVRPEVLSTEGWLRLHRLPAPRAAAAAVQELDVGLEFLTVRFTTLRSVEVVAGGLPRPVAGLPEARCGRPPR